MLENLGKLTPADRAEIYAQAKSDDVHERGKALPRAAALPPMPDPGLIVVGDAREALARAVRVCRLPEFQPKIQAVDAAPQDDRVIQPPASCNPEGARGGEPGGAYTRFCGVPERPSPSLHGLQFTVRGAARAA